MDDLLEVFHAEALQSLGDCQADVDRLQMSPEDDEAVADLLHRLRSIREMAAFLGLREIEKTAAAGLAKLETIESGEVDIDASSLVIADCLTRLRHLVASSGHDAAAVSPALAASDDDVADAADDNAPVLTQKRAKREKKDIFAGGLPTTRESPGQPRASQSLTADRSERASAWTDGVVLPLPQSTEPVGVHSRRRLIRRIVLGGGGMLAAATVAAAVLLLTTDPREYAAIAARSVQAATGRTLAIGGDVELHLLPSPAVVVEDVSLSNAGWGSRPQMVSARRLEIVLAPLPLLSGRLEARRVVLHGADILLETDAQGQGNWVFRADGVAPTVSGPMALPAIHNLSIDDSTVSYRDGKSGRMETIRLQHFSAQDAALPSLIDLDAKALVNTQPVELAGTVGSLDQLNGAAPYPIDLHGDVAGLAVTAKGVFARPLEGRGYSLTVSANGSSLSALGALLATGLPAAGPFQFASAVDDSDGSLRFHDLNLHMGQSELSGDLVLHPMAPKWRIDATLTSSHVDLGDLRTAGAPAISSDPHIFPADPLPLAWLGDVDAAIKFSADRVTSGDVVLSPVALDGEVVGGRATLTSLRLGYLGGDVAAKGTLDTSAVSPAWQLQASARHLTGGEALHRLLGIDMLSGGTADVDLNLSARGRSQRELASTLAGTTGLNMAGGHLTDGMMRLLLTDPTQAVSTGGSSTADLRCLTSRFDFADGVGRSRQFVADTGVAAISGKGNVNLRAETVDMRFTPSAKQVSLAALAVPVDVRGSLADPSVSPDPIAATTTAAGAAAGLATEGLAGAVLGLAGAGTLLADEPVGGCAAISSATTAAAQPAPAVSQPAPATAQKPKKKQKKSTTTQILDGATDVVNGIGSSLNGLFDGSTPTHHNSTSSQGSKD